MIDHLGYSYENYAAAKRFFATALKPLGYEIVMAFERPEGEVCGFGAGGKPDFWIHPGPKTAPGLHLAFRADTRSVVDAFHAAALAAGAADNGGPGLRPHYHPAYYAAFVRDPDGHNIEAVCHAPD